MQDRHAHNDYQRAVFRHEVAQFREPMPDDVVARLRRIVDVVGLEPSDRVLDAGTGTGALIPHLQRYGVSAIVGCDVTPVMVDEAQRRHPDVSFWCGDVVDLPARDGAFDAVFLNAMFGNVWDQRDTLRRVDALLSPTGRVCISHPLGRRFVAELHRQDPERTPHLLPDRRRLRELTETLDLKTRYFQDLPNCYIVCLHRG